MSENKKKGDAASNWVQRNRKVQCIIMRRAFRTTAETDLGDFPDASWRMLLVTDGKLFISA